MNAAYNVQCIHGHVYMAKPGSQIEALCANRGNSSQIGAYAIGPDDCPDCQRSKNETNQEMLTYAMDYGCPACGESSCGLTAAIRQDLREAHVGPYADQLVSYGDPDHDHDFVEGVTFNGSPALPRV